MKSLPALAIKYRVVVVFLVTLFMAWGLVSYTSMPRREDPEFTIRVCVVSTSWPGVATERVEQQLTYPIEEAIDGIEEVDFVRSTTTLGLSTVFVEVNDNVPPTQIEQVWDKVRAEVSKVKLPNADLQPIVDSNFGDTSILLLGLYQVPLSGDASILERNRYSNRELEIHADKVKDALRLLDGVADVSTYGVQQEAIFVQTDLGVWSELDLEIGTLKSLIASRNINSNGGTIDTKDGRYSIQPGGQLNAESEINNIVVGLVPSGETVNQVYLKDIGLEVKRAYRDPPTKICRFGDGTDSHTAIMIGLTMESGANIVDVCESAKQKIQQLTEIEQALPADVRVTPVSDQSENVSAKIQSVIMNVLSAIVIVVVVVYLVVGFRSAAVMAANIPVVVLASLAIITLFEVQLEQISLASIIIALGLLVDNAVQVCDQSRTNQLMGMKPVRGTVEGAMALSMPMLSGTATTIAAFLPMLFMLSGGGKEYVYSLPVTVSTTLATSWIIAMTFCVLLAAWIIRVPANNRQSAAPLSKLFSILGNLIRKISRRKTNAATTTSDEVPVEENSFLRLYGWSCNLAIKFKFLTVAVAIGLLWLATQLPIGSEFFPQDWRDQFVVEVWLPESATIEQTNTEAKRVEKLIRDISVVKDESGNPIQRIRAMRTIVGGGGARWHLGWSPESPKPNYAEILIRTVDGRYTPEFAEQVRMISQQGDVDRNIDPIINARVIPKQMGLGPPAKPVELRIIGNGFADINTLRSIADSLKQIVAQQPETWNVFDTWGSFSRRIKVDVDEDKASLAGISNSQIADTLSAYYSGHLLTTFREGDHSIPVYFRLKSDQRETVENIPFAFIEGNNGKIPLDSVASLKIDWQPARLERRKMNRVIEVRSEVYDGVAGNDVVNRIIKLPEFIKLSSELPPGYKIEVGGSLADSKDASAEFLSSFGVSLLLIVLILVFQYNSLSKPFVIVATLPLALIGALPGLYLADSPLGFMPQLGIISLFGIVLNTGIIFIEFADILIENKRRQRDNLDGPICGISRSEFRSSLIAAGKQRMLPIFLTTATTIGGLIPLALSGGPLWEGMAWCMICGLAGATVLTLFVVPALYAILVETFGVKPIQEGDGTEPDRI